MPFFPQALSGVGEDIKDRASVTKNTALSAALNTQFLFQIGVFTAIPMVLGFILEQGFLRVCNPVFIYVPFLKFLLSPFDLEAVENRKTVKYCCASISLFSSFLIVILCISETTDLVFKVLSANLTND